MEYFNTLQNFNSSRSREEKFANEAGLNVQHKNKFLADSVKEHIDSIVWGVWKVRRMMLAILDLFFV